MSVVVHAQAVRARDFLPCRIAGLGIEHHNKCLLPVHRQAGSSVCRHPRKVSSPARQLQLCSFVTLKLLAAGLPKSTGWLNLCRTAYAAPPSNPLCRRFRHKTNEIPVFAPSFPSQILNRLQSRPFVAHSANLLKPRFQSRSCCRQAACSRPTILGSAVKLHLLQFGLSLAALQSRNPGPRSLHSLSATQPLTHFSILPLRYPRLVSPRYFFVNSTLDWTVWVHWSNPHHESPSPGPGTRQ